jgi:hypothetical protein
MIEIDKDPFIKRIRSLVFEAQISLGAAGAKVLQMEAIALVEQNRHLHAENEKLKTYADINWLKRELDALTERVAKLEAPSEDR